jgi:hypothetical protein
VHAVRSGAGDVRGARNPLNRGRRGMQSPPYLVRFSTQAGRGAEGYHGELPEHPGGLIGEDG